MKSKATTVHCRPLFLPLEMVTKMSTKLENMSSCGHSPTNAPHNSSEDKEAADEEDPPRAFKTIPTIFANKRPSMVAICCLVRVHNPPRRRIKLRLSSAKYYLAPHIPHTRILGCGGMFLTGGFACN